MDDFDICEAPAYEPMDFPDFNDDAGAQLQCWTPTDDFSADDLSEPPTDATPAPSDVLAGSEEPPVDQPPVDQTPIDQAPIDQPTSTDETLPVSTYLQPEWTPPVESGAAQPLTDGSAAAPSTDAGTADADLQRDRVNALIQSGYSPTEALERFNQGWRMTSEGERQLEQAPLTLSGDIDGVQLTECSRVRLCGSDATRVTVSANGVGGDRSPFAHTEIQIRSGYEFTVLEAQAGLHMQGSTTSFFTPGGGGGVGANAGRAFTFDVQAPDGDAISAVATRMKEGASLYGNDKRYGLPAFLTNPSRMAFESFNSNSFTAGLLNYALPSSNLPALVAGEAASHGFKTPGLENPLPLHKK